MAQGRYWLGTIFTDPSVPTVLPDGIAWLKGQQVKKFDFRRSALVLDESTCSSLRCLSARCAGLLLSEHSAQVIGSSPAVPPPRSMSTRLLRQSQRRSLNWEPNRFGEMVPTIGPLCSPPLSPEILMPSPPTYWFAIIVRSPALGPTIWLLLQQSAPHTFSGEQPILVKVVEPGKKQVYALILR